MSTSGLMGKQNVHIHTVEYYSTLKGKDIPTHDTTWMNLEDIMLSEINQSQKDTISFHSYERTIVKINERESHLKWSEEASRGSSHALQLLVNCRPNRKRSALQMDTTLATTLLPL